MYTNTYLAEQFATERAHERIMAGEQAQAVHRAAANRRSMARPATGLVVRVLASLHLGTRA